MQTQDKLPLKDADGFLNQYVVNYAKKMLLQRGRGVVVLTHPLKYLPARGFKYQPEVWKLITTIDVKHFILYVEPPSPKLITGWIRGAMEELADTYPDTKFIVIPDKPN